MAGGELTGGIESGAVTREQVTELGAVLTGTSHGRSSSDAVTLFDSTGLAIQDLAIARATLDHYEAERIKAPTISL
jgi:ornithine cyclodeaminase/alanine dehydrogenase-like protein (mu-crystallin family)